MDDKNVVGKDNGFELTNGSTDVKLNPMDGNAERIRRYLILKPPKKYNNKEQQDIRSSSVIKQLEHEASIKEDMKEDMKGDLKEDIKDHIKEETPSTTYEPAYDKTVEVGYQEMFKDSIKRIKDTIRHWLNI